MVAMTKRGEIEKTPEKTKISGTARDGAGRRTLRYAGKRTALDEKGNQGAEFIKGRGGLIRWDRSQTKKRMRQEGTKRRRRRNRKEKVDLRQIQETDTTTHIRRIRSRKMGVRYGSIHQLNKTAFVEERRKMSPGQSAA